MISAALLLCVALQDPPTAGTDDGLLSQNVLDPTLAIVGDRLISLRDVQLEWELNALLEASQPNQLTDKRIDDLTRQIVEEYLWIDYSRSFEAFTQVYTEEELRKIGEGAYPQIFEDAEKREYQAIMLRRIEGHYARRAALESDADTMRRARVRHSELLEIYRRNPDIGVGGSRR